MNVVDFLNQYGFQILNTFISLAVGSVVTWWVAHRYDRKTSRDGDADSQQTLREAMLLLKTSLDNPQNAQERLAIAEEELVKARQERANAKDSVAKRNATKTVRSCLIRRLKVAQELPLYQRPSAAYAKLKEETDREMEGLIRSI